MSDTSLVIVSRETSFKLDNSMCVVDGDYESGYVYDEDIFMIEGIKAHEFYFLGDCSYVYFNTNHRTKTIKNVGEYWVHVERESYSSQEWFYTVYDNEGQIIESYSKSQLLTHEEVVSNYDIERETKDMFDDVFEVSDYNDDTLYAELDDILF